MQRLKSLKAMKIVRWGGIFRVSSWLLPTIQIIVFTLSWKKTGKAKGD